MIDRDDILAKDAHIRGLLNDKFGIETADLGRGFRKAGRRIPRHLQEKAEILVDAVAKAGHPKLIRMLDEKRITRAHDDLTRFLEKIDRKDQRKGAMLGMLGAMVFNLILVFAVFVVVLRWRGFL